MFHVDAIIPARSGSKGIERKNLLTLSGKTLVQIAIEAAVAAECFRSIIVSSDSEEILGIARGLGVKTHLRSSEASSDAAPARDYVIEVLDSLPATTEEQGICILQPTSPLREVKQIQEAVQLLRKTSVPQVSVRRAMEYREKLLQVGLDQKLVSPSDADGNPTGNRKPSTLVYPSGAIYAFRVSDFIEQGDIPVVGANPIWTTMHTALDIDHQDDYELVRKVWNSGV